MENQTKLVSNGVTVIIDGNSVAYRAFYKAPPLTADGVPTGVIHVFLSVLEKLQKTDGVTEVIVVFDARGKNKRHELAEDYKATRQSMPEDLSVQIEALKDIIPLMGVPLYCIEGYEADDVIYTLTKNFSGEIWLVTKDKDLHQLVNERIKVYDYKTNEITGRQQVFEKFGVYPESIIDVLSLAGDTSDNIPGVAGIGPKTAATLLAQYGSLDGVYKNLEYVKGKRQEKLAVGKESAYMSRRLAELIYIENLEPCGGCRNDEALRAVFEKYRLQRLLQRLTGNVDVAPQGGTSEIDPEYSVIAEPFKTGHVSQAEFTAFSENTVYSVGGGFYDEYRGESVEGRCFDIKSIIKSGVAVHGTPYDLMLISWLNEPDSGGLKQQKGESTGLFFARIASEFDYAESCLKELNLESLYFDIELPVARILAEMENCGIGIDSGAVRDIAAKIKKELLDVLSKISNRANADINVNSPKQLASYLYDTLGLAPLKKNKRGFSTDEETLIELKEVYPDKAEILDDILKYRELNKILSTYTVNMLEFVGNDGRIHSGFKQTGTATGRLSSFNPNLQNIPQRGPFAKVLRSAFISREGYSFVSFDYSQIELRILAHMSEDEELINAFLNDVDIHTVTAAKIFHLEQAERVTDEERRVAKAVNFGIIYGLSAFGLAKDVHVSPAEAKTFIQQYFSLYKNVRGFIDKTIEKSRSHGYCETILGRKRFIKDISSRNANIRQRSERMATNAPIQGSAADIIKLAMIDCDKYIKSSGIDALLILQIHDELVFEVKDSSVKKFKNEITKIMESVFPLKVPLKVNCSIGKNWGEL